MELTRYDDAASFLATAGAFLGAREAEHNLILGICSNLQTAPEAFTLPPFLAIGRRGPTVVLAALMTPPWNLVLSEVDDPEALAALVAHVSGLEVPGVHGPSGHAATFADLWSKATGAAYRLAMRERIFRLTSVRPLPHPAPGAMRPAVAADRDLIVTWLREFSREAMGDLDPTDPTEAADRWIARRGRTMYLWEDGDVVSLCGVGGQTPNGVRIGPVYTPPRFRGKGYAGSCVAAASALQLAAGRRFCFLFTDLANPTSNHIYQDIGYEPIRDVEDFRFDRGPASDAGRPSIPRAAERSNRRPTST